MSSQGRVVAPGYDHLLTALAGWVLAGCAVWGTALAVAALVEGVTGGRVPALVWVGAPAWLRHALLTAVGLVLVGLPAQAAAPPSPEPSPSETSGPSRLGLPVPARPVDPTTTPSGARAHLATPPAPSTHPDARPTAGPDARAAPDRPPRPSATGAPTPSASPVPTRSPRPTTRPTTRHTTRHTTGPTTGSEPGPTTGPGPSTGSGPRRATGTEVVVRPGDTLWDLVRQRLPEGSSERQVALQVRAWHAHNRRVIGPDPDLIRPGQRLEPPPFHPDARPHRPSRPSKEKP